MLREKIGGLYIFLSLKMFNRKALLYVFRNWERSYIEVNITRKIKWILETFVYYLIPIHLPLEQLCGWHFETNVITYKLGRNF